MKTLSARPLLLVTGLFAALTVGNTTLLSHGALANDLSPSAGDSWTNDTHVQEWEGRIGDGLSRSRYSITNNLSNMIWDGVSDLTLEKYGTASFSEQIDVHRRVFDNHDINNTYSVVDNFNLRMNIPLWSKSVWSAENLASTAAANFGISIGTAEGIELMDIRQVFTGDMASIPRIETLKKKITASNWYSTIGKTPDPDASAEDLPAPDQPVIAENDPSNAAASGSLAFLDPLRRARYRDFWNIFTFPVRIPFTPSGLKDLASGEVISYNVYGTVQVGASVGWNMNLGNVFNNMSGNISYSAYLRGEHRISVIKEDERYARVKITRMNTNGRSFGTGDNFRSTPYFNGFLVLGRRLLQKSFTIVPFQIAIDNSNAEAFDVGYRYDLTNPEAQKAYQLAMLGRFAYSDELAGGLQGSADQIKNSGVEKVFTRNQKVSTEVFTTGVNIASFYRHGNSSSFSDWDAIITLPEGTRRVVSTDTQNLKEWKTFWGTFERSTYSFRVSVDVDRYNQGLKDALFLTAEGNIEDSNTDGLELREYEDHTEAAVGEKNVFPRYPIPRPLTLMEETDRNHNYEADLTNQPQEPPLAAYGPSSFYFRLLFTQDQIEKFMSYPEEKMWPALEKAFEVEPDTWSSSFRRTLFQMKSAAGVIANIPLYLFNLQFYDSPKLYHAQIIHSQWLEIRSMQNINERAKALGHLFTERVYGRELVMLLRTVLENESISYTVTGENAVFGRIFKQGDTAVTSYPLPDRINNQIDYDRVETHMYTDNASVVSKLGLEPVQQGHQLTFGVSRKPVALYIRVVDNSGWIFSSTVAEFIVGNTGAFDKGDNTVLLSGSSVEPWATLARTLQKGKQYFFSMAMSADGQTWGPLNTVTYYVPTYAPTAPQK